MNSKSEFRCVAILGAGLIGASFGAAVEDAQPGASIVAFDKPEVLHKLRASSLNWELTANLREAVREAELVYIALPVVTATDILGEVSSHCMPNALVTDASSTKVSICRAANAVFRGRAKFVGGHPIAGRELPGFEHATPELFRGKRYALVTDGSDETKADSRVQCFVELLRAIGAEPVWIGAEEHDRAMAALSQMPQLVAIALAGVILSDVAEAGLPLSLCGTGLRDMLRTAGSPYEIWRDICATNRENIGHSLDRVARAIDFLREHLTTDELRAKFRDANDLQQMLRKFESTHDSSPATHKTRTGAGVNG